MLESLAMIIHGLSKQVLHASPVLLVCTLHASHDVVKRCLISYSCVLVVWNLRGMCIGLNLPGSVVL